MDAIKNINQALSLLERYILVSKNYGEANLFYLLKDEKIIVFNGKMSSVISKNDFKEIFQNSQFYIYKNNDEFIIDQEFKNIRQ